MRRLPDDRQLKPPNSTAAQKDSTAQKQNFSDKPTFRSAMDSFGEDKITCLLRLKRYEQPPPGYFENFIHEFHRRQDESLREPVWSTYADRARDFMFAYNIG